MHRDSRDAVGTGAVERALDALSALCHHNTTNADAIVLSAGGLDAVLSAMVHKASDVGVQWRACGALTTIATYAGPVALAALRDSDAARLIITARRNHPDNYTLDGASTVTLAAINRSTA